MGQSATVDSFGRVVIPKAVRSRLGLGPGSVLDVAGDEESIVLRPVREEAPLRVVGGVLVYGGEAEEDLGSAVERHRRERVALSSGARP